MSKGDQRRRSQVSQSQYEKNWDAIQWEDCPHCWHKGCLRHHQICCWCDGVMEVTDCEQELEGSRETAGG